MISRKYKVLGLMSGTSLDGIDLALVEFDESLQFRWLATETLSYSESWQNRLQFKPGVNAEELLSLNASYGQFLGGICRQFINDKNIEASDIDAIASHGHTWFHQPEKGFTYQLGCGPELTQVSGLKTVTGFRTQDIALGGQGAPLVPVGDRDLFSDFDGCLNLGGFANISFQQKNQRWAYDICPVNFVLNHLAQQLSLDFDRDGAIARDTKPVPSLLQKLQQLPYFQKTFPKSLGAEWVRDQVFPLLQQSRLSPEQLISTCTQWAASQISLDINRLGIQKVLITGGGALNQYLLERLQDQCNAILVVPEANLIHFKEALIFAYLGVLRLEGQVNVLSSATGARKDHCSGVIYLP